MKRYLLIVIGLMLAVPTMAQQIPLYSQYYLNPFLYNPAFTGYKGDLHATGIYRRMWTDINGAPETRAVTLDGSLSKDRVGLGGYAYMDYTDILERFGGYLSYAYYIKFKDDMRLGIGISAGVQQTRVDPDRARTQSDIPDPVLTNNTQAGVAFDGSAGISFLWKGLRVGFSVPQLIETQVKYMNSDQPTSYTLARHYLATASYKIMVDKKKRFGIEPNAMFRYVTGKQWQIDAGANFSYKEFIWLSVMYRYDYAVTFGGGFKVHDRLALGYAYDYSINKLNGLAGGTHEAFVSVKFGKNKKDEGLYEQIKQLKENQQMQQLQLDSVKTTTGELKTSTDSLKQTNEQFKKELEEKDKKIKELEDQIKKTWDKIAAEDAAATGDKKLDMPNDLVMKGNKDDLEFITGKPDNNYFMVVSSVKKEAKAREIAADLKAKGNDVGVVLNKRGSWYYIFITKPGNLEQGLKELYQIRKTTEFNDAWIHIYE